MGLRLSDLLVGLAAVILPAISFWVPTWLLPVTFLFVTAFALNVRSRARGSGRKLSTSKTSTSWPGLLGLALVGAGLGLLQFYPGPAELISPRQWMTDLPGVEHISTRRNPAQSTGIQYVLTLVSGLALIHFLRSLFREERTKLIWINTVSFALAGLAVWLLTVPESVLETAATRSVGTLVNENALAGTMALGAIFSAGRLLVARSNSVAINLLHAISFLLCLAVNIDIASRGGTAALLGGIITLAVLHVTALRGFKIKQFGLVILLGVCCSLLLAPAIVAEQITEGAGSRFSLWKAGLKVWQLAPWGGIGLGSFESQFPLYSQFIPPLGATFRHPDSSWVLLLIEFGIIGLGLLMTGIITALLRLRTAGEQHWKPSEKVWPQIGFAIAIAWAIAAIGDTSFHRPQILVFILPIMAIAFADSDRNSARVIPFRWTWIGLFAALTAFPFLQDLNPPSHEQQDYALVEQRLELSIQAVGEIKRDPYSIELHHRLGREAAILGHFQVAASHWNFVAALQPANGNQIQAYAETLHFVDPSLALHLWKTLLAAATETRNVVFRKIVEDHPATPPSFWIRVAQGFPDLLIFFANQPEPSGQRAFELWLNQPELNQKTPLNHALGAFARWGSRRQFEGWIASIPSPNIPSALSSATTLQNQKRPDLGWCVVSHVAAFPPPLATISKSLAEIKLSVLIDPQNFADHSRLIDLLDHQDPLYFQQLKAVSSRPDAPAWFKLRLAYYYAERGDYASATNWGIQALQKQSAAHH